MICKNLIAASGIALLLAIFSIPKISHAQTQTIYHFSNPNFACLVTLEEDEWGTFEYSEIVRLGNNDEILRYISFNRFIRVRSNRIKLLRERRANAVRRVVRLRIRARIAELRSLIRQGAIPCRRGDYEVTTPGDDPGSSPSEPPPSNPPPAHNEPGQNASACEVFGDSTGDFSVDIINGEKCSVGNSPVVYLESNAGSCTGTVISPRAVLSAGHCFTNGSGNLNVSWVDVHTSFEEPGEQVFRSFNIKIHPQYNGGVSDTTYDTALVLLSQDLPTRTMGILKNSNLQVGEKLQIAGYGRIGNGQAVGNQFDGLQAGSMSVGEVYSGDILAFFNHPNGANTCNGDSGGPAAVYRNGKWVVAGITSYGYSSNCGPSDTSGFENVTATSNLNFIKAHVPEIF